MRHQLLDEVTEHYPLLTAEEERALLRATKGSDKEKAARARDKLVLSNMRLVAQHAGQYARRGVLPLDDLMGEGVVALLCAIQKFNLRRGVRFATYATWWVRQKMQRACEIENTVTISHNAICEISRYRESELRAKQEKGEITPKEERILAAFRARKVRRGLEEHYVSRRAQPWQEAADIEVREKVHRTLRRMRNRRDAKVLAKRHGLDGEAKTLEQVGLEIGLTKERVRQLQVRGTKEFTKLHEGVA